MPSPAPDSYLEMEVTTATPQKLQLMLVEGAIRFIERTRHHWKGGQEDQACQSLSRAQQIITELISALNHDVAPELTGRVAALYLFVFRALVDAGLRRDEKKLDEALSVLEPQREAWQGVCRELGSVAGLENESAAAALSLQNSAPAPTGVAPPQLAADSDPSSTGFSAEA
jgi:flagellar protein FliS